MTRARQVAVLITVLGGAAVGDASWSGSMARRSSGPPPGWRLEESRVPYQLSALSGPLELSSSWWGLDFWRAIRPVATSGPAALSAEVLLPEGGQIEFWPAADPSRVGESGLGLVLERVGQPSTALVQVSEGGRKRLTCGEKLPAPGDEPVKVSLHPSASGLQVAVGGVEARCQATLKGARPAIRPGLRRVLIRDLALDDQPVPPPGPENRPLWALAGGLAGAVLALLEKRAGIGALAAALTSLPLLAAAALSGQDLRLWAETARLSFVPVSAIAAGLPLIAAGLAKGVLYLARALREVRPTGHMRDWPLPAAVAAGLPLAVATMDLPAEAPVTMAALATVGGMGGLGLGLVALLRRLGSLRPKRTATWITAAGALSGAAVAATRPLSREAVLGGVVVAVAALLLVWANANQGRTRWLNLSSLLFVAALVLGLEQLTRHTPAGRAWLGTDGRVRPDDIYGWVPVAQAEFQALEDGAPTVYPSSGNPIAIPPPDGRPRLVAMGGSTTGGAFQNDDLDTFYPARLERLLGRVQVLNQGVGGWTTWHIRRYVERNLEALDPDVLTLYVGHNDLLTPVPAPYSALFAAWERPSPGQRLTGALSASALFQGLRYLVTSLRRPEARVAVPIQEARQNLAAIADMVTARGGSVLLASEGLAPDPGPLLAYNAMMAELAEGRPGMAYVDVAAMLHAREGPLLFLDDCHLTDVGHDAVAEILAETLGREGLLPSHAGP